MSSTLLFYSYAGEIVIEDGTFESNLDIVILSGTSNAAGVSISGGTYINGDVVPSSERPSEIPLIVKEVTYPFGKTLDTWQANDDSTFTLGYSAEKIKADTEAALAEIDTAEGESKEALAAQLQININAIDDDAMRTEAQQQELAVRRFT